MSRHNRLWTDAVREVLHTKKKFISLLIMNFLAVGFLAGLRMTAPVMKHSLDVYYDEQNLMDFRIISMLGLTQDDIDSVMQVQGREGLPVITQAEGSKYIDALLDEDTVTVFSVPDKINRLRVTQGRLPQNSDECVVEQLLADKLGIRPGDKITLNTDDADKMTTQRPERTYLYSFRYGDQPHVHFQDKGRFNHRQRNCDSLDRCAAGSIHPGLLHCSIHDNGRT